MDGNSICEKLTELLKNIEEHEGTAKDIEEIRQVLADWDEYSGWR